MSMSIRTLLAPFATNSALLMATEDGLWSWLLPGVNEDRSGLQFLANPLSSLDVLAPHAGSKTGKGVVSTLDDLGLIRPRLSWNNWAEWLLLDDAAVVWRVVDDGWLDVEALAGCDVWLANGELVALLLGVLEEALDLLILHLVLDWSEQRARVRSADLDRLGELDHLLEHLVVDVFVNVDALGGDADLTGVLEGSHHEFWCDLVDVDVWQDDRSIVASEFEGAALESWGTSGHNLLASCDRASEGNFGNAWVRCEHWAEFVVTSNDLDNTGLEDLLCEFHNLEGGVWSIWAWLHDDGVASEKSGNDFAEREDDWEVPGADLIA